MLQRKSSASTIHGQASAFQKLTKPADSTRNSSARSGMLNSIPHVQSTVMPAAGGSKFSPLNTDLHVQTMTAGSKAAGKVGFKKRSKGINAFRCSRAPLVDKMLLQGCNGAGFVPLRPGHHVGGEAGS
jgi:hypothetical protein